jgi:hypothetical protein
VQITWIASYPKSGNTWVRFLLYHYLYGDLPGTAELSRRIPDIHRAELDRARPEPSGRLFVKTHWPLGPGMPHLDQTAAAIYIIRHPKDILLSALNYLRLGNQLTDLSDSDYAKVFIGAGGDPIYLRLGFGTWEQNVFSWTSQRRIPLLLLRYRDLKADAPAALRRTLGFLGEAIDEPRLRSAVEASSFERMRAFEEREKESDHTGTVFAGTRRELERGLRFMHRGVAGQSLAAVATIGPSIDEAFDRRFGTALWMLGYGKTALDPATLSQPA